MSFGRSELVAIFCHTVADDRNIVNDIQITGVVAVDTACVQLNCLRYNNPASDGTAPINLLHNGFIADNRSKFLFLVNLVGSGTKQASSEKQ